MLGILAVPLSVAVCVLVRCRVVDERVLCSCHKRWRSVGKCRLLLGAKGPGPFSHLPHQPNPAHNIIALRQSSYFDTTLMLTTAHTLKGNLYPHSKKKSHHSRRAMIRHPSGDVRQECRDSQRGICRHACLTRMRYRSRLLCYAKLRRRGVGNFFAFVVIGSGLVAEASIWSLTSAFVLAAGRFGSGIPIRHATSVITTYGRESGRPHGELQPCWSI